MTATPTSSHRGAAATLGAVAAIVLGLCTAQWWSPLVSVPLGLAVAVLIQQAGLKRREGSGRIPPI